MKVVRPNDIKSGHIDARRLEQIKTSVRETIRRFMQVKDEHVQYTRAEKEAGHLLRCGMHPFVQALHYAYCEHLALNISPDMIWYLVSSAVSTHMHEYASEKTRKKFFAAKDARRDAAVEVRRDDFRLGSLNPWYEFVDEFTHRVRENTKGELADLMTAAFSTTNRDVRIVSQLMLADTRQKHFKHEQVSLCGIPEIRIHGSRHDWVKLKAKADGLVDAIPEFKIWMKSLDEILQNFINVFDDQVDEQFWNNIYKCPDASGGPFVSGWVLGLFPYLAEQGKNIYVWKQSWRYSVNQKVDEHDEQHCYDDGLTTKAFLYNLNQCPFTWKHLDTDVDMLFVGGLLGVLYEKDHSVTPVFGHAVIENKCSPL